MSNVLPDVNYSKGAISATAVFIAMSAIVTTAYATGSISLIMGQFQSSSQGNAINWFTNNVVADARSMCENDFEQSSPLANNYSRHIPGLTEIEIGPGAIPPPNDFKLKFDGEVLSSKNNTDLYVTLSPPTCNVEFNGTASGDTISNMNKQAPYKYRLFSDSTNDITIQVYEKGE